jgi:ribosomal protein S12 methylthiotransferase
LRGALASRLAADVMQEAEQLVERGVRELLIISQDTSAYGVDIKFATSQWQGQPLKARFFELCAALGSLGAWVRLHYVYPYPHVDEVLPLMAEGKILPYLDIPFQHASPSVLKAMRRPANQEKTLERIARWREIVPDLAIRSTFIVGFPGETEDDFTVLLDWMKEAKLARVGCFKYENVEGAGSRGLEAQIADEVKVERYERFMETQKAISAEAMEARVGQEIDVIIDEVDAEGAIGRSTWDAPDIDGSVFLDEAEGLTSGDIVRVLVEETDEYDCWGGVVS